MFNESLWISLVILTFLGILLSYKLFGKTGLFVWTGVAMIVCNIQVLKTIVLFGMVSTLGNALYGTTFLVTDILNEIYGKKEAKKAVWIGFYIAIVTMVIMQICLKFIPDTSDFAQGALATIFGLFPRIVLASLTAYVLSQFHDIWAYQVWRKKFPEDSQIWIRNNASTMVSQAIDSVVFCFIAFWGMFPKDVFLSILITTYIFKFVVAISDTPFIYIAKWLWKQGKIPKGIDLEK